MQHKNFALKLKSLTEQGQFTGLASTYGNTDLGGDVIAPGAFQKSIQSQGKGVPILWQHQPSEPIGTGRLSDQPAGLQVDGQLLLSDPIAQRAYAHLQGGTVRGLSIGFDSIKSSPTPDGGRLLTEVRLWEISVVTFPMNLSAQVANVKALADVLPLLASLSPGELSDVMAEAARLLSVGTPDDSADPPDDAEESAMLLAEFKAIDAGLRRLLA